MPRFTLRSQLFFSHLLILVVGVTSFIIVSRISSPLFFQLHLEQLDEKEFDSHSAQNNLKQGFDIAWSRGTLWSVIVGGTAAGVLSYWVARWIMQPLTQMKEITRKFAAGQMDERVPKSEIIEIDQLGASFNRMAIALENVELRRRELVTDLTHELRTPLTVIRGYMEGLAYGETELSLEVYQRLVAETARLERLVNGLQELSRAEAGYLAIDLQTVDLYPLLKSLVQKFSDQLHEDSPALRLECPDCLPPVRADSDRVEQILINLLGNALRYTSEGSITIHVWIEPSQLWIAVIDTGHGIAPENLPYVFERFWRSSRSRAKHPGGLGIGLSISRRLVELQGGRIEAESQLNQGSIFRFCLPLAQSLF